MFDFTFGEDSKKISRLNCCVELLKQLAPPELQKEIDLFLSGAYDKDIAAAVEKKHKKLLAGLNDRFAAERAAQEKLKCPGTAAGSHSYTARLEKGTRCIHCAEVKR